MIKKLLLVVILLLCLAAWAPWISQDFARQRAEQQFASAWQGVSDGCGFNCKDCGAKGAVKTWFGYQVDLEYACGMLPADTPEYHKTVHAFVSFLGTVHGLPKP